MVSYSADIKNLAVQMYHDSKTLQYINKTLQRQISLRSLQRWMANYRQYQSAVRDPATYGHRGRLHVFQGLTLNLLADMVNQSPLIYLDKLQCKSFDLTSIWAPKSTYSWVIHCQLGMLLLVSHALDQHQCPIA
ncbi:hypothetical protein CROQUDRAFT_652199 [Cronartium quercuum f. sp. fusiforme G11]|uniref:Transposase n=1 Tax=Cronartium quercuum f. sp. fusiforme G11 TaxID=708437 RepID=A0A9P6NW45_9BASI|nr:hypothetical protein CROQUDRAFT_652199 [Cronartium quercuum f. sp. fusiforme G11]